MKHYFPDKKKKTMQDLFFIFRLISRSMVSFMCAHQIIFLDKPFANTFKLEFIYETINVY